MSAPSSDRPLIGICAVRERARWSFWDRTAHLVAGSYVDALQQAGAIAIVFPIDEHAPARVSDLIDGLLLIGGADVDPGTYGAPRDPSLEATYPDRDAFELEMLNGALERDLPALGICRGMQLLNVAFGGTLVQDLTGPDGTNIHRRTLGDFENTENHVELTEGSLVSEVTGERVHVARCHHHQAIDRLGDGLVVTGRTDDGVIEAVEHEAGWVIGVQWHPERTAADDPAQQGLFDALVERAER